MMDLKNERSPDENAASRQTLTRYRARSESWPCPLPDIDLRVHASEIAAATGTTYDETQKNLRTMLVTHAEEWRGFLAAQGEQSFLKSWMEGGRYGRFE